MLMIHSESIERSIQHFNIVLSVLIALWIILAPPFDNVKFSLPIVCDNGRLSVGGVRPITTPRDLKMKAMNSDSLVTTLLLQGHL
jgi:hypothetical protein